MKKRRFLLFLAGALAGALWGGVAATPRSGTAPAIVWPTPDTALMRGEGIAAWAQDTGTGDPHSGLFGCVRNGGNRFHEGIDIRPVQRDRAGDAVDPVVAAFEGRVAYFSSRPGASSYGRYIVLEHTHDDVPVYTLYGHLAAIEPGLAVGQRVGAGQRIGRMGHSSSDPIPRTRAHLHFEIGLRLTDQFQPWYDGKKFGSPNEHGLYNGMNLVAFDPVPFFESVRAGAFTGFRAYLRQLPTAYTLRVTTGKIPDFINRYPGLLTKPVPAAGVAGWDIDCTWYGLPKQWTPLAAGTPGLGKAGAVALVSYDRQQFVGCSCRDTLVFDARKPTAHPKLGTYQNDLLKLLFGFK